MVAVASIGIPTVGYSVRLLVHGSWQMLEDGLVNADIAIHFLWELRKMYGPDNVHLFEGDYLLTKGGT